MFTFRHCRDHSGPWQIYEEKLRPNAGQVLHETSKINKQLEFILCKVFLLVDLLTHVIVKTTFVVESTII